MKMTQVQMRQGVCSVLTDARPQDKGGRATFKTATAAANAARAAEAGAKEALEECKKVAKDERESFHRDEKTLVERLESLLDFRETGLRRICRVTLAVHAVLALAGLVFLVVMVLLTP